MNYNQCKYFQIALSFGFLRSALRSSFLRAVALAVVLSVVAVSSAWASSGRLTISPSLPRVGDRVTFTYKPDSSWLKAETLYIIVYRFNEMSGDPDATSLPLKPRGDGSFVAEYATARTDVFLMARAFNGSRYDDNNGNYWDVRLSADGSRAVQGAYFREAMSYLGSLPVECSRNPDFLKALALLREEVKLHPNNLAAKIAEIALAFDVKDVSEEQYRRTLDLHLSQAFDTTRENDTRAVIRALNAIGKADRAVSLENEYIRRFPSSKIAEDRVIQRIQVQTVPDWFIQQAVEFVRVFKESPISSQMQGAAVATFAQVGRLKDAARWLDTLPNVSAIAYNELAKYWARLDSSEERGLRYARIALELAKRDPLFKRPAHISDVEWTLSTGATMGDVYNTLTAIYVELKRPQEALETFYLARDITAGALPPPAFSAAASILFNQKKFEEAHKIASEGIIMTGGDEVLMKWHRAAYDSLYGAKADTALYSREVRALMDSAYALVAQQQIKQRLDRELIDGVIFTHDRKPVELSSFKGKPTMLMFWSSWAEPCLKAMPFVNVLYNQFQTTGDAVNIIVIDAWEEKERDQFTIVRDYMERNAGLYFKLYVDQNNAMAQKYGVTGLPMRFYLDKNGRIQYKGSGFTDGLKLTQEMEETLQLLMNERFYINQ
jgi:thiol-disulfide isomerase/thioredoxin